MTVLAGAFQAPKVGIRHLANGHGGLFGDFVLGGADLCES